MSAWKILEAAMHKKAPGASWESHKDFEAGHAIDGEPSEDLIGEILQLAEASGKNINLQLSDYDELQLIKRGVKNYMANGGEGEGSFVMGQWKKHAENILKQISSLENNYWGRKQNVQEAGPYSQHVGTDIVRRAKSNALIKVPDDVRHIIGIYSVALLSEQGDPKFVKNVLALFWEEVAGSVDWPDKRGK